MEKSIKQFTKFPLILSNFILKIVAIVAMTFDHIGYMLQDYGMMQQLASTFRFFGRLAFPLFCFMIVEGVIHTKNFKKYILRLGICLIVVSVALLTVEYLPLFNGFSVRNEGNIFVDLLLGALAVFCLKNKKIYVKFLALLPLGFAIGSSIAGGYECIKCGIEVWIVPFFLRTQYGWYGVLMIILFYFAYELANLYLEGFAHGAYKNTDVERLAQNITAILMLIVANLILFIVSNIIPLSYLNYMDVGLEMWSTLSGILILFYNGKRGYNAPWFKYGCYVYYGIHMIVIYGLFALII